MVIRYAIILILCGYYGAANAAYFGAGFGNATVDISSGDADSIDDSDSYTKLFGGVEINPNLSVEFGHIDFGEYSAHYPSFDETDTAEGYGFTVSALGIAPLNEKFKAFFRAGLNFWSAEYNVLFGFDNVGSGDGSGNGTFWGAGISYSINENVDFRLEFEKYADVGEDVNINFPGFGSSTASGSDVETAGAALTIAF